MLKACPKHPKYKGKGKPKVQCEHCLSLYFERLKMKSRIPVPPTKIHDDTKYKRIKKINFED